MYGDFLLIGDMGSSEVFAYKRWSVETEETFPVVLNFLGRDVESEIPNDDVSIEKWAAGNYSAENPDKATIGKIVLKPWEGLLGCARFECI